MDCLFCKIIAGEIPSEKVFENEKVYAFKDISPQAPEHVVIVPKLHIESANDINPENAEYISAVWQAVPQIARQLNISSDGYRVVNNCGVNGGQTVNHIHFHLMGGRAFSWPAG